MGMARNCAITQILGTDMKKHFDILSRFQVLAAHTWMAKCGQPCAVGTSMPEHHPRVCNSVLDQHTILHDFKGTSQYLACNMQMRSCAALAFGYSLQLCSHGALEWEGKEKPVLMLQAAFKRPSVHSDHHQTPRQSLDWDRVKPEDKTLVHQVRFID